MKVVVQFSGGKDSQACLVEAINRYGIDKIEAVFCDTGWEHPDTYKHIDYVIAKTGVKFTTIKGQYDFVGLAKHKKRFPSTKARFCTEELKVKPMIDWVLEQKESLIIIQGIRSGESTARANMEAECMYFKGYFQSLGKDKNGRDKYYSYRKKDIIEWCKKYDATISRPIKEWTAQNVIDCILNANQVPNPLYYKGFSRVGCFPCIMCRQGEILNIANNEPKMLERLINAEQSLGGEGERGSTFFPPTYIPKRFIKNKSYPYVQEVVNYVRSKSATLDMYEPAGGYACMSMFHGLCE